jgi:hypothetical protein
MKVKNVQVYGLPESIIRSGYSHQIGEPADILDEYDFFDETHEKPIKRAEKLANVPIGSGEDCFLKGIIVQFDLCYTQYMTPQLQRYNFLDIISSQSKMHSITKIEDIEPHCNKYVLGTIIIEINN